MRERGLKQSLLLINGIAIKLLSLPVRERGLKHFTGSCSFNGAARGVAPRAGSVD